MQCQPQKATSRTARNAVPKRLDPKVLEKRVEDLVIGSVIRRRNRPDRPARVLLERGRLVPPHRLIEVAQAQQQSTEDDQPEEDLLEARGAS